MTVSQPHAVVEEVGIGAVITLCSLIKLKRKKLAPIICQTLRPDSGEREESDHIRALKRLSLMERRIQTRSVKKKRKEVMCTIMEVP